MSPVDPVLDKLQAQCVKREYCTFDIYRKALAYCKDDPDPRSRASEMVTSLQKDRFVDDRRYACAFAREKSALGGWGPLKIRTALLAKHIGQDVIKEALSQVDGTRASSKLEAALENKWKSFQDDPQGKYKLIRFALSRGYEYDVIRPLVERITSA